MAVGPGNDGLQRGGAWPQAAGRVVEELAREAIKEVSLVLKRCNLVAVNV